ncbi:type VI secretion system membrane subunit TssM [Endozoicomonas arenosclerae]|uniref:type VI secretion system membrane subunit TssM n=1 Tax=Endozoicomonas arenosclerae TaxID=1633495 RepID=UPI000784D304|nr:type VI secretion system membrane subunit TssM [Endozoicomonas arenosclerae]
MRRVLTFLGNPWVIGIIGLCAFALTIWFGADYVKFGADNTAISYSARLIIILSAVFIWVIWRMFVLLKERSQNNQLLDGIQQAQAEEESQKLNEDTRTREELDVLNSRFRDAITVLKKSNFKVGGRGKSLYQLPWYIIIGPPGSGKTTALVNSGLQFPLADSHGKGALGGVGGTRHCDWWFTNNAVLIDTSGRYTTQDSHRVIDNAAWTGFLDLLKKYRRRRPINGVMIAISLQDLMVQTEEQRNQHAKVIRARLDELHEKFGVQFPVYLTFTKADLIAGFSEFFANLTANEREQVWGTTFEFGNGKDSATALANFDNEFQALLNRLNERVLRLVHQERDLERRSLLQGFPSRMASLQNNIRDFLQQTFNSNNFSTSPLLRGFYFTSGTQEGTPIDRMMASISASFDLPRSVGRQQMNTGKSFFISRLLNDIIFPESELVGVNRQFETSLRWMRRASIASMAAVLAGAGIVWTGSVTKNKQLIGDVSENVLAFEKSVADTEAYNDKTVFKDPVDSLPAMDALLNASKVYDQEEHPWLNSLGLYDSKVDTTANNLYDEKLLSVYYPALLQDMESQLRYGGFDNTKVLELLRIYLMLLTPEKRDPEQITQWATTHWEETLPGEASKQTHLKDHLDRLLTLDIPASEGNARVIAQARQQIKSIPIAQRLYGQLKDTDTLKGQVDLYSVIGGDTKKIFGLNSDSKAFAMPAIFTRNAYENAEYNAESKLLSDLDQNRWLYGQTEGDDFSKADKEKISEQIQQLYLTEYSQNWQTFVSQFHIAPFKNISDATSTLKVLSDPVYSPLQNVLEVLADNTELTRPVALPSAAANVVPGANQAQELLARKQKPTVVDLQFRDIQGLVKTQNVQSPALQDTLSLVRELHDYLNEINLSPDPEEKAFKITRARFASSGNDVIKRVRIKASQSPQPVKSWLNEMADSSWSLLLSDSRRYLNKVWKEQVFNPYRKSLYDRYPMTTNNDREAPMQDFNRFFKPNGIEQQFFNEYLKPFVNTRTWKTRKLDGKGLAISSQSLRQFITASKIRRSFYHASGEPAVNFRLQPTKMDSDVRIFSMELGEQRIRYSHGPRIVKKFTWDSSESSRARIVFEDLNETVNRKQYEGDWALFKLLDKSELSGTADPREFNVTFNEQGRKASFKLIADSSSNPFNPKLLRSYQLKGSL